MITHPKEVPSNEVEADEHVDYILSKVNTLLPAKYKSGNELHLGNLRRKRVMSFMGDELLDHIVYFFTLEEQLEKAVRLLKRGVEEKEWLHAEQSLSILTIGNPEGIPEDHSE